jgi:anti-sigma factor RsiW
MTCDESIERLPWFLNGTLEEGEHDEVRRHLATCEACRAALKDTREAWAVFDQHLPSEALVALAYEETPEGIDPSLAERHLATCPQCAAELELARMSRRLEEDEKVAVFPGRFRKTEVTRDSGTRTWRAAALAASLTSLVAASGWLYEFQQSGNLLEQMAARKPAPVQEPQSRPPAPPVQPGQDASAAQLAEMRKRVEASEKQVRQAQEALEKTQIQIADLSRTALAPEINPQSVEAPEVVRGTNGPKEVALPARRPAMLVLPTESDGVRNVEIVDGGGKVLWSAAGLRSEGSQYMISFHAGFLKPGGYTIRLLDPKTGETRETYALAVK